MVSLSASKREKSLLASNGATTGDFRLGGENSRIETTKKSNEKWRLRFKTNACMECCATRNQDGSLQSLPGASVHAILLERKGVLQAYAVSETHGRERTNAKNKCHDKCVKGDYFERTGR